MDWEYSLARLLTGEHTETADSLDAGAEILVTSPAGEKVFHAALARHYRLDGDEPCLVWVRPVFGAHTDPATKMTVFPLGICRRRALAWTRVNVLVSGGVEFQLRSGQHACIRPATGALLSDVQQWDDFVFTRLTAAEERELTRLDGDSWIGRFS